MGSLSCSCFPPSPVLTSVLSSCQSQLSCRAGGYGANPLPSAPSRPSAASSSLASLCFSLQSVSLQTMLPEQRGKGRIAVNKKRGCRVGGEMGLAAEQTDPVSSATFSGPPHLAVISSSGLAGSSSASMPLCSIRTMASTCVGASPQTRAQRQQPSQQRLRQRLC